MTTMKRIVAVLLAVMLIASIGVIGASAAGEKLTLDATGSNAEGFTFTVYQVATLNMTDGKYTASGSVDSAVMAEIAAADVPTGSHTGKTLCDKLDAAANVGTSKGTLKEATMEITEPGIYYVKVTDWPDTQTKKLNSVVVWPEYDGTNKRYTLTNSTVELDSKVASGADNITKYFSGDSAEQIESKSLGQGDVVTFVLEASVVGSVDEKVSEFVIWDKMSKGLTYNNDAKVYYDSLDNDPTSDFAVAAAAFPKTHAKYDASKDAEYEDGTYITVSAKEVAYTGDSFYGHTTVYVQYTATVNNNASVGAAYNPNKDGLVYTNSEGKQVEKNGRTVKVYTYEARAKKVNGDTNAVLQGAEFALYSGTTVIANGTSDSNGIIKFYKSGETNEVRLAPGEYKVVETKAPAGYALNTTNTYTFTVNDTKANNAADYTYSTIPNYPTKLPETGGMGTMMFTIIGGCLVLIAGAMFVVIMKKRSSSK